MDIVEMNAQRGFPLLLLFSSSTDISMEDIEG